MAGTRRRRGRGRRRRHNGPYKRKEDMLYLDGEVMEALPNTMFLVRADNGLEVLTTLCGKMRRNRIRVTLGDRVSIEVSPYDVQRGRITFRHRNNTGTRNGSYQRGNLPNAAPQQAAHQ